MCSLNLKGYIRIRKQLFAASLLLLLAGPSYSQAGDGKAGIEKATELVKGYFESGTILLYVIGAVVGLIGAVKVYNKWSSGDQDTSKAAASWFGACIFLVVVATVLRSFYGL